MEKPLRGGEQKEQAERDRKPVRWKLERGGFHPKSEDGPEIEQAIGRCRGDRVAEPRLTGTWIAHLLISSKELLHNLLIDTVRRPQRL
jgi:hypothetical protein